MYWFYTYRWAPSNGNYWHYSSSVFAGSFLELVQDSQAQPEQWSIVFAKEISEAEYAKLDGTF